MKLPTSLRALQISEIVNGRLVGQPDRLVLGLNEIHKVEDGDISFVDHPKYYQKCLNSKASVVLINKELACPEDKTLIVHEDPVRAYNMLVTVFRPFSPQPSSIDPDADISPSAIIQPGVFIGRGVRVGPNAVIHSGAVIGDFTSIGSDVIIQSGVIIGSDAYYYKRREFGFEKLLSCGRVIIEDNVEIGAASTIARGVSGDTVIGTHSKLDAQVHIGHGTVIGKRCLLAAQVGIAGKTTIEDDVILWGQVGVSKDLVIGAKAVVLAQSGVSKSLPGGKTYFGSPAREVSQAYREMAALRRAGKRGNPDRA